jgi:hypothetical protein
MELINSRGSGKISKERALGFDVSCLPGLLVPKKKAKSGFNVREPVLCEKRQIRAELSGKPSA